MLVFKEDSDQVDLIVRKMSLVFSQEGLLLFLFISFGMWCSTRLTSSRPSMGISLGIVFFLYLLGIVGELDQKCHFLRAISLIHVAIPNKLLTTNLSIGYILTCLGLSGLCLLSGWYHYTRKDLSNQ